jgi:hypothetical protein
MAGRAGSVARALFARLRVNAENDLATISDHD